MTNNEAIEVIKLALAQVEWDYPMDYAAAFDMAIKALGQKPRKGHWIKISPANIYECSECGQNIMTQDICAYKFCHGCGAKMVEPQESEDQE